MGRAYTLRDVWWTEILDDPAITGVLLGAALAISTEARGDGTHAVISTPQLAKDLGVSLATAKRYTKELREIGYLKITERGHRRGDGVATANTFELSLPVTQMSQREEISTAHPDEPLSDSLQLKPGASTAQIDVSTAQIDVSTAHPDEPPLSFSLSNSPSHSPSGARDADALQTADGDEEAEEMKQDQQKSASNGQRPDPQCAHPRCGIAKSHHDRHVEMGIDRHPFKYGSDVDIKINAMKRKTRPRSTRT